MGTPNKALQVTGGLIGCFQAQAHGWPPAPELGRSAAEARMRLLGCLIGAIAAAAVGAFTLMEVGEVAFVVIDRHAPGYFAGRYPWAAQHSQPGFDAPRKIGWGNLLFESALCGGAVNGLAVGLLLLLQLGGLVSVIGRS